MLMIGMAGSSDGATLIVDDDDGSWRDHPSIGSAIVAASDGDLIRVFNGTYKENVVVNVTVAIIGNGTDPSDIDNFTNVQTRTQGYTPIFNLSADRVEIGHLTIGIGKFGYYTGYWPTGIEATSQSNHLHNSTIDGCFHGLEFIDSHNNTIVDNLFTENACSMHMIRSDDNLITNNTCEFNHYYDIHIMDCERTVLLNNTLRGSGVFIEGSTVDEWTSHSIDEGNTVNGLPVHYRTNETELVIPDDVGQIILANVNDTVIRNRDFTNITVGVLAGFCRNITIQRCNFNHSKIGVHLSRSSYSLIEDNDFLNITSIWYQSSIYLLGSHHVTVRDNLLLSNSNTGILLYMSDDCLVEGNIQNNLYGIQVAYSENNTIKDNECSNGWYGLRLLSSEGCTVKGNTFRNHTEGMTLSDASYNVIKGNQIDNNSYNLKLVSFSDDNLIENNMIETSRIGPGMVVDDSSRNEITGNTFTDNTRYAIEMDTFSNNNVVHHNTFIDNGNGSEQQCYDNSGANAWDNGTEGNWWSDYFGLDGDGDGVGDTPYDIDNPNHTADAEDRYPIGPLDRGMTVMVYTGAHIYLPGRMVAIFVKITANFVWPNSNLTLEIAGVPILYDSVYVDNGTELLKYEWKAEKGVHEIKVTVRSIGEMEGSTYVHVHSKEKNKAVGIHYGPLLHTSLLVLVCTMAFRRGNAFISRYRY